LQSQQGHLLADLIVDSEGQAFVLPLIQQLLPRQKRPNLYV
jgi:hypothetical protein